MNLTSVKIHLSCSNIKYHTQTNNCLTNMSEITFYNWYNCPIDLSNTNIVHITFPNSFNQQVVLPVSLEYLDLGWHFKKLIRYPKNLKVIIYNWAISYLLPKKIQCVFSNGDDKKQLRLPKYLIVLKLKGGSINFENFNVVLPKYVLDSVLDTECSQPIMLNKKLRKITCGFVCTNPLLFPKNMRLINLMYCCNSTFVFPKNLLCLIIRDRWRKTQKLLLVETLKYLEVSNENSLIVDNVSNSIERVSFRLYDKHIDMRNKIFVNLPNSMGKFHSEITHVLDYRIDINCWSEFALKHCTNTEVVSKSSSIENVINNMKYLGLCVFTSVYGTNI